MCQNEHAALQERLDKADSETVFLQTQLQAIRRQRDALSERYGMLQKSYGQTEAEMGRLRLEQDGLQKELAQLEQDRQTVDRERQELEAGYAANISSQATTHKAAKNFVSARLGNARFWHVAVVAIARVDSSLLDLAFQRRLLSS